MPSGAGKERGDESLSALHSLAAPWSLPLQSAVKAHHQAPQTVSAGAHFVSRGSGSGISQKDTVVVYRFTLTYFLERGEVVERKLNCQMSPENIYVLLYEQGDMNLGHLQ
jgi:hypothetical protein